MFTNVRVVCRAQTEVRIICSFSVIPRRTAFRAAAAEATARSRVRRVGRGSSPPATRTAASGSPSVLLHRRVSRGPGLRSGVEQLSAKRAGGGGVPGERTPSVLVDRGLAGSSVSPEVPRFVWGTRSLPGVCRLPESRSPSPCPAGPGTGSDRTVHRRLQRRSSRGHLWVTVFREGGVAVVPGGREATWTQSLAVALSLT